MLSIVTIGIITKISIAVGLGAVLGLERTLAGKTAGMRTYSMVALGSSVFVMVSQLVLDTFPDPSIANPLLVASAIVTGIGFIGAGLVIFQDHKITGLTTAAGLWVAAGIGMASGFGLYSLAAISTIFALIVFTVFWFVEKLLKKFSYEKEDCQNSTEK